MNLYSKLIFMTLAFMICNPWTGWAGANTNNPYCEHDPACWEPIDDLSAWYGTDCCRHKAMPPQPHPDPDDHCWEYNWDDCEWARKTPDCKALEEQKAKMALIIFQLWARLRALKKPAEDAETCCACNNGDKWACGAAVTRNIWPCPEDACDKATYYRNLRSALIHMLNVAQRDWEDAKRLLDNCRKCC